MTTTQRVLAGLAAGAILGLALAWWEPNAAATAAAIAQPIGKLWLSALQMTVVPLVFALVVLGVNSARDAAASGRTARVAIVTFLILLALAATIAALLAPFLLSLLPRDAATAEAMRSALTSSTAAASAPPGPADWLANIVPTNAIAAAANGAMLPLVVFALFLGFALPKIDGERRAQILGLLQGISEAMIVVVRWVLWAAPIGVFALVLAVTAKVGFDLIGALGAYIALQSGLYLLMTLLMYVVAIAFGGEKLRRFASGIAPAQGIAASTQSSLASLPVMLECARTRLGYRDETSSLVLPMAASLFRITSPVQYVVACAFIAWASGIEISMWHMLAVVPLTVVVSMGSVGLPGQVSFMATNMPVAQALGLPVEPLGLLLAVDTIPDVFSTIGNVTADLGATAVVDKRTSATDA